MLVDIDPLLKKCKEIYNRRTPFAASLMIMEMEKAEAAETENITEMHPVDEFKCAECGFTTQDLTRYDEEDDVHFEYECKFCPDCGRKVKDFWK